MLYFWRLNIKKRTRQIKVDNYKSYDFKVLNTSQIKYKNENLVVVGLHCDTKLDSVDVTCSLKSIDSHLLIKYLYYF